MKKILFIGAHSDDIEIGCGGTVSRFLEEQQNIILEIFSCNKNLWPEQSKEFLLAMQKLGITEWVDHDLASCNFDKIRQDIYMLLENSRDIFRPDIVFTHSSFDTNQDHQVICAETKRVFKKTSSIYGYEFPNNNLKFDYDLFIKLKEHHINKKIEVLQCYKSQLPNNLSTHNYLDQDYIKSLAVVRGQQVGVKYAECFEVIREVF